MITRDERQKQCLKKWLKYNGHGTIVGCTGFGKTRIGLNLTDAFVKRNENASVLVVVPTQFLKDQWIDQLEERGLIDNTRVEIVNSVIKLNWTCDLLILDEVHLFASETFKQTFECVNYKNILCLTGTLERLDGKEVIIKKYAPVCDEVPLDVAIENHWVAPVKEYLVLVDVDLTDYMKLSNTFNQYFAYFDYKFSVAMDCSTDVVKCRTYAKQLGVDYHTVMGMAQKWNRAMRARKAFIQNHPKKFEIAKKILEARKNKKCITFSSTIKQAESFGSGYVLHSKKSEKQNKETLEAFNNATSGVLHSSKAVNQGVDVPGLSVGIILSVDSSKITKQQRKGRICRFEEGKEAELFTVVLRNTQEYNWAMNSATSKYITIDENQLDKVLAGESIQTRQRELITNTKYRF